MMTTTQQRREPSREEMNAVFMLCRNNHWTSVYQCLQRNPQIGETVMIMDNHITTTVCHQAITSKGDIRQRAMVITKVLSSTPNAARLKNGYNSLPLHVICQRNTKLDAETKEKLLEVLIQAYPGALLEQGGVSQRTPLHIIFTDYVASNIIEEMIAQGKQATYVRDKSGYLPAHIAASRHVSPDKLRMLLEANPDSIMARTNDGMTLLSLAQTTATASHPNYRLIGSLRCALQQAGCSEAALDATLNAPCRVSSGDTSDEDLKGMAAVVKKMKRMPRKKRHKRASKRVKVEEEISNTYTDNPTMEGPDSMGNLDTPGAADLLLHFASANPSQLGSHHPVEVVSNATIAPFLGEVYEV